MSHKFLLLFLFFSVCSEAMEVSCQDVGTYYEGADIVFVGTVIDREGVSEDHGICWTIDQGKQCGSKVATFKIEEILKGSESNTTTIYAGDGCYCVGPYLDKDKKYLVFGIDNSKKAAYNSMNGCATQPLSESVLKKVRSVQ